MPRIVIFEKTEDGHRLAFRDVEAPEPGPNDVRYKVHAFALNRADILYMEGRHYVETEAASRIGYEACGIVDAVGENVTQFKIGDRVTCIPYPDARYGVAGEYAITPEAFLAPWPENLSAEEACSVWMQYLTAYYPLKDVANVGPGDTVLVTAASSSAGLGAIQLGKLLGARVIATTRTAKKRDALLEARADAVVVTDEENLSERMMALTDGAGVRVVYDAIGGSFVERYADGLADDALIYVYGLLGGDTTIHIPILPMVRPGATLNAYSMINHARHPRRLFEGKLFVSLAVESGRLRPVIGRVFSFEETAEAYSYMESSEHTGKLVVRVSRR